MKTGEKRRIGRPMTVLGMVGVLLLSASTPGWADPPAPDYAKASSWLCRPDLRPNACDADLTSTAVLANGSVQVEPFKADPDPPIDCFYVYPTVSHDPGVLADPRPGPDEINAVRQQFARLGAVCRLYAPVYRQVTLTALDAALRGHPLHGAEGPRLETPYEDVAAAWSWYLKEANHGRGVVLIGHSQGAGILTALIARKIDGERDQAKLVSAILMGTDLLVPTYRRVGGAFRFVPLCRDAAETGCVMAFASFLDTNPPPPNSLFGRPRLEATGLIAACVNPANPAGGPGPLKPYFATRLPEGVGSMAPLPVWDRTQDIQTPFVSLPGLLVGQCVSRDGFNYLSVHIQADSAARRAQTIPGETILDGKVQQNWGLHLVDANLVMGNLVDLIRVEGAAWNKAHARPTDHPSAASRQ